jgi:hypothetical protein
MARSSNSRNARPASPVSTPVRNSAIPKAQPAKASSRPIAVSRDSIAKRAFEISMGPQCGSEVDNWLRAERELMGR